jgi:hypothetical protein
VNYAQTGELGSVRVIVATSNGSATSLTIAGTGLRGMCNQPIEQEEKV